MTNGEKHFLYSGENFGMAGIESWAEYLTYLGDDRWEMIVEENALSDFPNEKPFIEPFTTEELVMWVLERDSEHMEEEDDELNSTSDEDPPRKLYEHGEQLLFIAREEKIQSCIDALEGWLNETWPPEPEAPTILRVTGATKRGVWIRVWYPAYSVETSAGPGYVWPSSDQGMVTLVLQSTSTSDKGWQIKLSKELAAELSKYQSEYDELCRQKRK